MAVVLSFTALASSALAHGVNVSAWIKGNTVHTISKFPSGGDVSGAGVTVYDAQGNRLLSGKTSTEGEFSFAIPKNSALTIVVSAGPGHQGHRRLPEADVSNALDPKKETAGQKATQPETASAPSADFDQPHAHAQRIEAENLTAAVDNAVKHALADTLDKTLDRKLAPVMRQLAGLQHKGPTANDIFGGIGYIVGLFGIAAYVRSRRQ